MGGAASVLGLFESLRLLRPAIDVVGLIPSCENMLSGRATKPGDVVTSMSGQTIEVLNTDAEGRLILCDALTYAERFKPRAVVDIATLTGNCVLALGNVRCGLFSANDKLAAALAQAADAARDLRWRMPMDDAYGKGLQSNFADMGNIGGRTAGAISAAKFSWNALPANTLGRIWTLRVWPGTKAPQGRYGPSGAAAAAICARHGRFAVTFAPDKPAGCRNQKRRCERTGVAFAQSRQTVSLPGAVCRDTD